MRSPAKIAVGVESVLPLRLTFPAGNAIAPVSAIMANGKNTAIAKLTNFKTRACMSRFSLRIESQCIQLSRVARVKTLRRSSEIKSHLSYESNLQKHDWPHARIRYIARRFCSVLGRPGARRAHRLLRHPKQTIRQRLLKSVHTVMNKPVISAQLEAPEAFLAAVQARKARVGVDRKSVV